MPSTVWSIGVQLGGAMPRSAKGPASGREDSSRVQADAASMTDAEINEAQNRLKKLAKAGPPPDERKNGSLAIVEKLYDQIAGARATGWNWQRIKTEIGPKVEKWKPETLERYFQRIRKARGTTQTRAASTTVGRGHPAGGKKPSREGAGGVRAARGEGGSARERQSDNEEEQNLKYDAENVV